MRVFTAQRVGVSIHGTPDSITGSSQREEWEGREGGKGGDSNGGGGRERTLSGGARNTAKAGEKKGGRMKGRQDG